MEREAFLSEQQRPSALRREKELLLISLSEKF